VADKATRRFANGVQHPLETLSKRCLRQWDSNVHVDMGAAGGANNFGFRFKSGIVCVGGIAISNVVVRPSLRDEFQTLHLLPRR
jgi:hypothetical protein